MTIDATRLTTDDIDITIDDINFLDCPPVLPSESECGGTQYTCSNQVKFLIFCFITFFYGDRLH